MAIRARAYWTLGGLIGLAALILIGVHFSILAALDLITKPSEHRLPFPADKRLTEREAIELTRRALILDGKRSDAMRPVPSGHKDSDGREMVFLTREKGAEEGSVLWWLERPACDWEDSVSIRREGDEVVCTIVRPL